MTLQGEAAEMKACIDRVIGDWELSNDPSMFGYLLGMHAFSLEENHLYVLEEDDVTDSSSLLCFVPGSSRPTAVPKQRCP